MEANEQIIALLTDIRDLLKTRPTAPAHFSRSTPDRKTDSRTGELVPPDAPWASFEWPAFTRKKAREVTLGESVRTEKGRSDLTWWANSYVPKPWKGSISEKDEAFKDALDAAKAWLASPSSAPEASAPRPSAPPDRSPQYHKGAPQDEDVPFGRCMEELQ